jgi:hypothetical protein
MSKNLLHTMSNDNLFETNSVPDEPLLDVIK